MGELCKIILKTQMPNLKIKKNNLHFFFLSSFAHDTLKKSFIFAKLKTSARCAAFQILDFFENKGIC